MLAAMDLILEDQAFLYRIRRYIRFTGAQKHHLKKSPLTPHHKNTDLCALAYQWLSYLFN